MSRASARLSMGDDLAGLSGLLRQLRAFAVRHQLGEATEHDVVLAVEEIVTNTIVHGFGEQSGHRVDVGLDLAGDTLRVTIEDDGRPFDLLARADPPLPEDLDDAEPGGLGILLVRRLMDEVRYEYVGGRNVVHLTRRLREEG